MAEGERRGPCGRGPQIAVGSLRLVVAGSSCSVPRDGRACSAYLIEDGGFRAVLDFGTGAFANIRRYADYDRLDAVVLSHMHADHFLDVIPLRYALKYGSKRRAERLPMWMPPGGSAMLRRMCAAFASEGDGDFLDEVFVVNEYDPSAPLALGPGRLRFAPTTHYVATCAIRYENGGASLTYSADTAPDRHVAELARGTDIFICEATLLAGETEPHARGHSTALEAATMAHEAEARRLVLTHYAQDATERDLQVSAAEAFRGPIDVADDHAAFVIAPR